MVTWEITRDKIEQEAKERKRLPEVLPRIITTASAICRLALELSQTSQPGTLALFHTGGLSTLSFKLW